jgi:hypothetical protein
MAFDTIALAGASATKRGKITFEKRLVPFSVQFSPLLKNFRLLVKMERNMS